MSGLALLWIRDIAIDDGDNEIAFVGEGDTLGVTQRAVAALVAVGPSAAEQVGDANATAGSLRARSGIEPLDVDSTIDCFVGQDLGPAIGTEVGLQLHINVVIVAGPGAGPPARARGERPREGSPPQRVQSVSKPLLSSAQRAA